MMTDQDYRDDSDVQTAIRALFLGAAPEREAELSNLWQSLSPIFRLTGDVHEGERFIMDAVAYRYVRFNHRAVRAFWLASYAAWEGYRAVGESPTLESVDIAKFKNLLVGFEKMISSDKSDEVPLPLGVAE